MMRTSPVPRNDMILERVSFHQSSYSEHRFTEELASYLTERFRGAFTIGELLPGEGYILLSPDGFAFCLRQLLYPTIKSASFSVSYKTEVRRPVLTLTFSSSPVFTPQKTTNIVRTAASSGFILTMPQPNVFCFHFERAKPPAFAVYAFEESALLRSLEKLV